jgi:glycerol dehydrogenase
LHFSTEVGLPTTLAHIGLDDPSPETLERIAGRATAEGETIYNEPFEVLPDMVVDAIRAADALGRDFSHRCTQRNTDKMESRSSLRAHR